LAFDGIANLEKLLSNCATHAESTSSLSHSLACLGELWINYSLLANSRGKRPCAFKPGQVGVWLARGLNQTNNYHKPFLEEHWAGRTHV
jgi:hypothetical protein